jgi:uncharacterized membrane protein
MPLSPLRLLALAILLGLLLLLIQFDLLVIAFDKLGLSPVSGMLLLFTALVGSTLNLPVTRIRAWYPRAPLRPMPLLLRSSQPAVEATILIAVNAGGCIIPVCFSGYLMLRSALPLGEILIATAAVSIISYSFSRPVPRLGIAMPPLVAPLAAAIIAIMLDADNGAPLAYISGTLGVLIGADLLRINDVRRLGAPLASIGGAGTFDGIFITGIVATLLA